MATIKRKIADMELLEGGGAGGMGGGSGYRPPSTLETVSKVGGPAALAFAGGAGGNKLIENAREKREAEAAAEMKREASRVEKTGTDRAREAAAEMKLQERTNKAYEDASKGMKQGGAVRSSASKRADGCALRGKTRI
jgi:hypothetical protein